MPTVDTLTECVPPINPAVSVPEVFNWFQAHPDAMVLPVVDDGRPVGLIDRQDFLMKLAEPLGHSRYSRRPVSWIMDNEPAVVEADVRISSFSDTILKSSASTLMRGFIVTREGRYFGVGTAMRLFHFVNQMQAEKLAESHAKIAQLEQRQIDPQAVAEAQSRFVETLTQTLSAPFNTIDAFGNLIGRHALASDIQDHVSAIQQASREGTAQLRMARDLAHAEANGLKLNLQAVVLRNLVEDITKDWTDRARTSGVTMMVGYDGDTELAVMLDPVRFRATCDTLISSALKWAREGMIEVSLKAAITDQGVDLQLRVRDDGTGLDEDQIQQCFGPLSTTGDFATAMAWHLLKSMDGEIFVENNHGRGTTYGFDVCVERAAPEVIEEPNVAHLEGLELSSRPHVLIADDNATNRVVARALCEMFGCTSETVENGQEAVDIAKEGHFDLILMDIKMPRLDGVQATQLIRALPDERAQIPIIALTANADPDDVEGYMAAGMACVVEKPIKPERLRMAIIRALSDRDQAKQNLPQTRLAANG